LADTVFKYTISPFHGQGGPVTDVPAYKLIEDRLRAFLGRSCQALTNHVSDPIECFVTPKFDRKTVTSLELLEIHDYCHVLLRNFRRDREHSCGVLFDRQRVDAGLDRDLAYCKELRHRYAHLRGIGEPVPVKDQLSDVIIVTRLVRELTSDRPHAEADRELLAILGRETRRLVERVAEVVAPEKYDRDEGGVLSEAEKGELVARIAGLINARKDDDVRPPGLGVGSAELASAVALRLAELHALVERIGRDVASLGGLGETSTGLREDVQRLVDVLAAGVRDRDAAQDDDYDELPLNESDESEWRLAFARRPENLRRISTEEARERLIALRRRIWEETGSGPSADGILRKSMIDAFLQHRPKSSTELRNSPVHDLVTRTPIEQQRYVPDVLAILDRLER